MMKIVTFVLVGLLVTLHSFSQRKDLYFAWPINESTQKIEFSESVYMPDSNGDTLYSNASKFVQTTFKGERDSVIVKNDTTKNIICRGAFYSEVKELGERGKGYIYFTFSINCNKNSYKYTITNFQHFPLFVNGVAGGALENETAASGGALFPRRYWNEQKAKCYQMVQTTIERLKEAMNKNSNS